MIATPTTVNSNAYARAIHHLRPDARVYSQTCPLFVPLVEEGWLDHPVTRLTAEEYLKSVLVEDVDTLVLGVHALSAAQALIAGRDRQPADHCRFGGHHGGGHRYAPG